MNNRLSFGGQITGTEYGGGGIPDAQISDPVDAVCPDSADLTAGADDSSGKALYASLCLIDMPYRVDRLFDYLVPEALSSTITRGDFVRVPFGASDRPFVGLVLNVSTRPSGGTEIGKKKPRYKYITEIISGGISLSEEQVSLCEYMHEHILCSYGDAVHAMIPPFVLGKPKLSYRLTPLGASQLQRHGGEGKARARDVLRLRLLESIGISSDSPCAVPRERLLASFSAEELRELIPLEREGMVETEFGLRRIGAKFEKYAVLSVPPDEAEEYAESVSKRAPVMSRAIRSLLGGGRRSVSELRDDGIGADTLKRLEARGMIKIEKSEIYRAMTTVSDAVTPPDDNILTEEQTSAYDTLSELYGSGKARAALLHGVTGSGKTRVIKAMIDRVLADGRRVIVLVPEISLTPQTVGYFQSCYGDRIAVIHSMLSQGERYDAWRSMKRGDVDICIGTRSAIFAPFDNIGMIVIDEEQEHTYKSDTSPKYSAVDIARFRSAQNGALMLLASATPSVESYYRAVTGRYTLIELIKRYSGASLPDTVIADVSGEQKDGRLISETLDAEIRGALAAHRQIILFMNRRGYNHFVSCPSCREAVRCPNCSISLTYHASDGGRLHCHFCGYRESMPEKCPSCGSPHLTRIGFGIQRVEEELAQRYPDARVMRMDADTTASKFSFYEMIERFKSGDADILIGTQMVTKGHDFPGVDVSGVILADMSLYLDDYRANERTFSMITQLVGRAGRAGTQGRAVIQTYAPDNPVINLASKQDYKAFFESEIKLRRAMVFPPFCRIALISVSSEDESQVARVSGELYAELTSLLSGEYRDVNMICFGPYEATVYRVKGRYRYRIICKLRSDARTRSLLRRLLIKYSGHEYDGCTVGVDIDPSSL